MLNSHTGRKSHQKAADMKKADRDSQMNQALLKGLPLVFRNLRTQSKAVRPKNIMMDSIKMNLDCVSRAVSANRKLILRISSSRTNRREP